MPVIPATQEAETEDGGFWSTQAKKFYQDHVSKNKQVEGGGWHTSVIPATQEVEVGRFWFKASPGQNPI
jgi:hypothetical protein